MLRIAFASTDRKKVDQHFGSAEAFAIYEVEEGRGSLVGVGQFAAEAMDGNEGKLAAKVEFLAGCHAVYVMAIGGSAIKQLLAKGIQPIRVDQCDLIHELLAEVSNAMTEGGVPWIDRAIAAQKRSDERFAEMDEEGWQG